MKGGGVLNSRRGFTPYLLILPAIAVLLFIIGYPLLFGFRLSFTNMNLYTFRNPAFNGLSNYRDILAMPEFYTTLLRTVVWTFVNVFFHVTIGMFLAICINRNFPGKNFFRVFLMIPWAIPQYIAVVTWKNMFRTQYGTIDIILNKLGITGIAWLSDPSWTFVAAIITNIWLGIPFMMMVFYGALKSVPHEMYEAGEMDGVNSWQKHMKITIPLLKPVAIPAIVLGSIWTFNMVNVIFIMTDNTGNDVTQILVTRVYKDAFTYFSYGKAAAFSVLIFIILAMFSWAFIKANKSGEGVYE